MAYDYTPRVWISDALVRLCTIVWKSRCDGGGGTPPGTALVYWGNWADPLPSTWLEGYFLLPNTGNWAPNAGGFNSLNRTTRPGTYEFSFPPPPTNWWQVLWFPDTLLNPSGNPLTITVNGFPFGLQPSPNQAFGSLTINGVPGKLFISNGTNNGGFTVSGGNPMTIS